MLARLSLCTALATGAGALEAADLFGDPPVVVVSREAAVGPVLYRTDEAIVAVPCRVAAGAGRARLYFTFLDPQGIDYAAVDIDAETARPVMSEHVATYLWVTPANRAVSAFRWRFEDAHLLKTRHTIPVWLEVLDDPVEVTVSAKDGAGHFLEEEFALEAAALCR